MSKSAVRRQFVRQSGRQLEELAERRFEDREFLILYIDGLVFGEQHVICAMGVDTEGKKQVLGIYGRGPVKTAPPPPLCWKIWWSAGWIRSGVICS